MNKRQAIQRINKQGVLLVFPVKNKVEPNSLWKEFYPRKQMEWEWTEDGDDAVPEMWSMMKKLSDCGEVVYSKWYQGRATFFSKKVFTAMVCVLHKNKIPEASLARSALHIYEILQDNSPLSTKQLKLEADLQGRDNEGPYHRSCKELFSKLLIVGFGEVDDGAFPSLSIGSTQILFETVWRDAFSMTLQEAREVLDQYMPEGTLFRKFFDKVKKNIEISVANNSFNNEEGLVFE